MKAYVLREWEEICGINESSELYRIFIRGSQAFTILAIVAQAIFILWSMARLNVDAFLEFSWIGLTAVLGLGKLFLLSYAERAIRMQKFRGTAIGLFLALLSVPSYFFPLGLFGLYCFLNPAYQRKYLSNAPAPFIDFLKVINLDFTAASAVNGETEAPKAQL